jgi:hypothetical protein
MNIFRKAYNVVNFLLDAGIFLLCIFFLGFIIFGGASLVHVLVGGA